MGEGVNISTFRREGSTWGLKQTQIHRYELRTPKSPYPENLNVLLGKTTISKFWPFRGGLGGPKSKFRLVRFLAMVGTTHSPNIKALAQKLREEIDFNRFTTFRGVKKNVAPPETKIFQHICYQGPKIYNPWKFEGPSSNNKKVQNFDHFWNFFVKFWGPKSKFRLLKFLAMVRGAHPENIKAQTL